MISDKIAFVILTWNSQSYVSACLESVLMLSAADLSVYVVDNGSTDETPVLLETFRQREPERIHVTNLSQNEGTTKSRNRALKEIPDDTKWVCILDSDTIVSLDAMEALICALTNNPSAMLAAPRMWKPGNEEQLSCKHFPTIYGKLLKGIPMPNLQKRGLTKESYAFYPDSNKEGNPPVSRDRAVYEVDYAISACWMLRKNVLNLVGFLDEHYMYAPEDVDYCAMIWEMGYKVLFVSGASIYHNTQRLSHKKLISPMNRTHLKGLLYYFRKHNYYFVHKIR